MTSLRWGVLGASARIYRSTVAPALQQAGQPVVAEARRDASGSDASYAELLRRPDVDAVYIPLANVGHAPWIVRALEAGKHVLCEKPLTLSAADTDAVFAAADSAGLTLAEAYTWPHHPRSRLVLDLAREHLGRLHAVRGRFTFPLARPDDHRLDARGAGALFDVGIYCLGPAVLLASGEPVQVAAAAVRNDHGVDVTFSGWLELPGCCVAGVHVSFDSVHIRSLEIDGSGGSIRLHTHMVPGPEVDSTVAVEHRDGTTSEHPAAGANAFVEMIQRFVAVAREGAVPLWGATESRRLARWIDALHAASTAG